jgi:hypothetical protein
MRKDNEPLLIFLRVPKTAGGSFYRVLVRQFREKEILDIETLVPSRDRSQPYDPDVYHRLVKERLLKLPEKDKVGKRLFIEAHLAYGLHEFFPQPASYVTFFRDPVKRAISHYLYVLRATAQGSVRDRLLELGFESYVKNKEFDRLTNNVQTRLLCGEGGVPKEGQLTQKDLAKAKERLRNNFAFVGITERFDESLVLAKRQFNWKDIFYYRLNVTRYRFKPESLTPEVIKLLEEKNKFDIEIYKYACELLDEKAEGYRADLAKDIEDFKRKNTLWGKVHFLRRALTLSPRAYMRKARVFLNSLAAMVRIRKDTRK